MDLQNFIKETLVQIARGIDDANKAFSDDGLKAIVNPRYVDTQGVKEKAIFGYLVDKGEYEREYYRQAVHAVEFDVALVATEGKENKGTIGVMVGSIGLGGQGKSNTSASENSRIKFTIPMIFPAKEDFPAKKDS